MKRILALAAVIGLSLSMAACDDGPEEVTPPPAPPPAATPR